MPNAESIAERLEVVHGATVEARSFLARVKPRSLKTDAGRVVTTDEVAKSLVRRAELEHAVLPGGPRPAVVVCDTCHTPFNARKRGPVPTTCDNCMTPFPNCVVCGVALPRSRRGKQQNKTGKCRPCTAKSMAPKDRAAAARAGGKAVNAALTKDERSRRMREVASKADHGERVEKLRKALRDMPEEKRKERTRAANIARHGSGRSSTIADES